MVLIPKVNLIDANGKDIGLFSDDPSWWEKLKQKEYEKKEIKENKKVLKTKNLETNNKTKLINTANSSISFEEESKIFNGRNPKKNDDEECNMIGETPLHIAIMYDDLSILKLLIEEKGFDVNQRSISIEVNKFSGGFNSKEASNLINRSDYENLAYFGEYPLAFAACFANKEIYDYLVEKGADPNLQDSNGNAVLHVLVINNKIDMFRYISNHPKAKPSPNLKNKQGFTPLILAAKLGRKAIFEKMLEIRNIEFWRYSNITCSATPLEGLDTIDTEGKILEYSSLAFIVNGETDDNLEMLEIGVIRRLLSDKWATYAKMALIKKSILSFFHLLFLSIAVYTRAADTGELLLRPQNANTVVRYISELLVIILCLVQLFFIGQQIYEQGIREYLKNLKGEPANVLYLIFDLCIILAIPFRFVHFDHSATISARNVEDSFLIIGIPCGWCHLLLYARVSSLTGPLVVMIYKMIVGDILRFASIWGLFILGFSLGFYYLFQNNGEENALMIHYPDALYLTFQMSLGEFNDIAPQFNFIYYSIFVKIIWMIFMILVRTMLMSMLIAMMGNTYQQIYEKSAKEYYRQWANIILLLERSFTAKQLQNFQSKYSISLPAKDGKREVGLMDIRKIDRTKPFEKSSAIKNWKVNE